MRYKWSKWFAQIVFGFLLAIVLEFLCSVAYFSYHGIHISETVFFDSYLLPIVLFIMIINLWYADWLVASNIQVSSAEPVGRLSIARYAKSNEVVYITISNGFYYSYNAKNEPVQWHWNIGKSIKGLPFADYFQVSRSLILHRSVIEKLNPEPRKRKLTLTLKEPFSGTIEVTRNAILQFNQWWGK